MVASIVVVVVVVVVIVVIVVVVVVVKVQFIRHKQSHFAIISRVR